MNLSVTAHTNAKIPRIEKDEYGYIHVYVSAQAHKGEANTAIIKALAVHLKVKKDQIILTRGEKSRKKLFKVLK